MSKQIRYLLSALVFALTAALVLVIVQPPGLAQPNFVWLDQFGSPDHDAATAAAVAPASLKVDSSGNLYVAGAVLGALAGQARVGHTDAFLMKYGSNGQQLWARQFGSPGANARVMSVALGGLGDVYVASLA